MVAVAQIIGGAGCGKTTELLRIMELVIEQGIDPMEIGFVSFTRAARAEAASRAAAKFGISQDLLEQGGWFRTLHSVCYRQLKLSQNEVLSDRKADREWLKTALQIDTDAAVEAEGNSILSACFEQRSEVDMALGLWGCARNRLVPFADVWEQAKHCEERTPDLDWCVDIIKRYELAKSMESRLDFTDMLGRFTGWRFGVDGHEKGDCRGDVPYVPVWFLDEAQDNSALTDAVARRLVEHSKYAYICGDPFQAIFGWSGADPKHFMAWGVADKNRHVLPRTFRYGQGVLDLGESILREQCSDYFHRGIASADHDTEIETCLFDSDWLSRITPGESWLLIARTNFHASRIARRLEDNDIPWTPLRGMGGVNAPVRNSGLKALYYVQCDIDPTYEEWRNAVSLLPAKLGGEDLLVRGAKTRWKKALDDDIRDEPVRTEQLAEAGATPRLIELIRSGRWVDLIEGAERWREMCAHWETVDLGEIPIRVGTIHSAKGAEADNVLVLQTSTAQIAKGMETEAGRNEEGRVAYVAVTRAKRRLIVAKERCLHRIDLGV